MAEIEPFKAWRYNPQVGNIKDLVSPLFDVVNERELNNLYQNPFNSIHLSVPRNISLVPEIIQKWKSENIILHDELSSIYVYYQYYKIPGHTELKCCKGIIANIKIHEWNDLVILRHEATMPHSVNDRLELLEKTEMNISPTHGLYTDEALQLEKYMEESISSPLYEFTDYQGVINKLGVITDTKIINKFKEVLRDKKVILADGHHRYTASLEYKRKLKNEGRLPSEKNHLANFHCMYLSNTESNDITIFPTHRIIRNFPGFNQEEIIKKLNNFFSVELIEDPYKILAKLEENRHSFGILFKDKFLIARLKEGLIEDINWNFPREVNNLDLTVMHFFIIEKVLGIKGKEQKNWKNVNFSSNFTSTVSEVLSGSIQMAMITRDISIEEVKSICYSGYTFPYKSTFFYPKVVSGLLFDSIKQE